MSKIEVHKNKSLRLDNVLINKVFRVSTLDSENDSSLETFSIEAEVAKMNNEIITKGAQPVGPLVQYSGAKFQSDSGVEIEICLMIQADRFINNINATYVMEPVISVKNCMYTRFTGLEEDINFAYQKIQVEAYENEIKLKGSSFTIFLDSDNETGFITADIFMERRA
ncbi:MAG: hypothetical protein KBS68_01465 [Clostridiales bacterium]|nr:hypothetical protein [Candidatus Crickella merdequi]